MRTRELKNMAVVSRCRQMIGRCGTLARTASRKKDYFAILDWLVRLITSCGKRRVDPVREGLR
jgi:hypothetical protein